MCGKFWVKIFEIRKYSNRMRATHFSERGAVLRGDVVLAL